MTSRHAAELWAPLVTKEKWLWLGRDCFSHLFSKINFAILSIFFLLETKGKAQLTKKHLRLCKLCHVLCFSHCKVEIRTSYTDQAAEMQETVGSWFGI